jgi:hypothetical protein
MAVVTRTRKLPMKPPHKIREILCKDWGDVTQAFGSFASDSTFRPQSAQRWIYRGQADASWALENSLRRTYRDKCKDWAVSWMWNSTMVLKRIEGQLAFDFASKAQLHGLHVSVEQPVALLSAMQHFRAPTRLLDWTYSAYVALFFALEREHPCDSAAVWAINVTALHQTATRKVLPVKRLRNGTRVVPPVRFVDFSRDDNFKRYVLPDLDTYHRTHLLGERALEIVVPIVPGAQNERLSAQQGLFLCPSKIGTEFMEQAERLMSGNRQGWIVKVIIPRTLREEALRRLFQMNVHPLYCSPAQMGWDSSVRKRLSCGGGSRQLGPVRARDPLVALCGHCQLLCRATRYSLQISNSRS